MKRILVGVFCVALVTANEGCRGSQDGSNVRGGTAALTAAQRAERSEWLATANAMPGRKPPCAATGRWAPCNVFNRLDRAGLAPRIDSSVVREPGLEQVGTLVRVGSGELRVYLYPDSASRRADEQRLERGRYIEASAQPTMRNEATVIRSNNLLGILKSRSETQRERVALAFAAGAPI